MASTSAAETSSETNESPNWLEMPDEVMVSIFQRLPTLEILNSARKVCTTWLKICEYPAMWKVISIHKRSGDGWDLDKGLEALTMEAVGLSCGELIDISLEGFGSDDLVNHILVQSSKLKRLSLVRCFTAYALCVAVEMVPQLEELYLSKTCSSDRDIELIGQNCPRLKSFTLSKMFGATYDSDALAIADNMCELRHLEIVESDMTNNGLEVILNGCPHLDSLYVRMCDNLDLDGDLGKLCIKKIKDFRHD